MFLQIHTLTAYPASLLNRDDAGLAKRIPFGNAQRLRVSSQCLKRHWREDLIQRLRGIPDGLRTRSFFTRTVLPKAIDLGAKRDVAQMLVDSLIPLVMKESDEEKGKKKREELKSKGFDINQPVLFGLREADYFAQMLADAAREKNPAQALDKRLKSKEEKENLRAMGKSAAGLTAALFGRMVTSDLLSRVDAPVHVAHAFTVHAANTEMDFFTVVDDLNREDETRAAHANQTELGAGIYYGYVAVDIPLLVSNLTGCAPQDWKKQEADLPRRVLDGLVHAIAEVSPGAKLGSTAPYSRAEYVLFETGAQQPRQLANAFLEALPLSGNPMQRAAQRLGEHLNKIDKMYEATADHRYLATICDPAPLKLQPVSLQQAIEGCLNAIWSH
jgi:CRISPR system Cascade subunit CasC